MGQGAASEGCELLLVEQTFMEHLLGVRSWTRCVDGTGEGATLTLPFKL